jgi:hypothetical protein
VRIIRHRPLQRLPHPTARAIQTFRSSSVVKITGMAFGWIGFNQNPACSQANAL